MKKNYTLLEVLFAQGPAELLRILFTPPHKQYYVRELMGMSGLSLSTVQHALRKLDALRLVTSWSNRYHRFYRANRSHSLFRPLVQVVQDSEQTPRIDRSMLNRKKRRPRGRRKLRTLPIDRPIKWNIFSKRTKT